MHLWVKRYSRRIKPVIDPSFASQIWSYMRAASLGHQYLAAKSLNQYENFSSGTRFRRSRRNQDGSDASPSAVEVEQTHSPATDPVTRRTSASIKPTTSSTPTHERSASDSASSCVVYKPQKGYQHLEEGNCEQLYRDRLIPMPRAETICAGIYTQQTTR